MTSPMPVEELPSFLAKNNRVVIVNNDPWLKYVIVGGIVFFGVIISVAIIERQQKYNFRIKPIDDENRNK